MARCKACGAPIIWIKLKTGKNMPCDAQPIHYSPSCNGNLMLITPDGAVLGGGVARDDTSKFVGYTSHFATCPAANQFRRRDNEI